MPLATRGLIAPQNMFLEDLIARSKNLENCFVLANAKQEDNPIVYCSDGYCCLTGYQRHEVLHKAADYEHLYGEETDRKSVSKLKSAFALKQKIQHELTLYKKDGTPFIAAIQIAPVKNEDQEVIMFLITLRDISALRENQNRKSRRFSLLSTTNNYHHSHSSNNISNGIDRNSDAEADGNAIFFRQPFSRRRNFELTPTSHAIRRHEIAHLTNMDTELPDYKEETPRSPTGIILHYSTTKVIWDWVILFFTFYTAIFVPFELAFNRDYRKEIGFLIMDCIVDVIFLSDVVINFRTTYVDGTGHIISHPPLIVRNYITGWFVIDLLAALPYEIFTLGDSAYRVGNIFKVLRLLRLSRFIRKFNEYVEYGATMIVLLMFTYVLVAHWLACIWYRIGFDECTTFGWLHSLAEQSGITAKVNYTSCQQISVASAYSTSLYFTMSSLTTVGFGNVSANTIGEKIFSIIIMIIGSLMSAFIFGNVTAILQELYSSTQRYHAILKDMKRFNQVYSLPKDLRRRVEDYFISSWAATKGIDTKEILKYWPKEIQAEIKMHMNRKILRDATCFSNASEGCLRQMAERFEMQHTGPGDILIHSGQSLNHLYFIACGSFEVYSADVGVTCILTKGDVFGDDFIKNKGLGRSHSMVRALTYCDLHTISRIHLLEVAGLYPEWAPVFSENLNLTCSLRDSGSYENPDIRLSISNENFHPNQMVNIQELYRRNDLEVNQTSQSSRRGSALLHPSFSTSEVFNGRHAGLLQRRRSSQPVLSTFDETSIGSGRRVIEDDTERRRTLGSDSCVNIPTHSNNVDSDDIFKQDSGVLSESVGQLMEMYSDMQQDVSKLCSKMAKFEHSLKALNHEVKGRPKLYRSRVVTESRNQNSIRESNLSSETSL